MIAALGTLAVAPMAHAATLTVDDNGVECPAAGFSTVQNAVFAAAKGDTITVCPGTYVEGSGAIGSNAVTIVDDVTIKGAGADLVRIVPRSMFPTGSQIAESTPNIRNNVGAIVMIDGDSEDRQKNTTKTHLTKVDISGVTIDGNGVYAEAGIVFRDAVGSVSRSRVTNVVTTEKSFDAPRPGEYKGSPDGYGIAQVTAPGAVFPTVTRQVKVDHTRIDKYNAAGVLLDSATGDTLPLVASGVTNVGTLLGNQIVGRTVCINYLVNGNCQVPAPLPATNGPLYGQDGVRITAGSSATLTDNTISQNLVQGTGSAVPGAATNNSTLWMAAGVRLLGAGATTLVHNNVVDNSYGVFNAKLDGTSANTAVPVKAEDNWWGLRTTVLTGNPGPAISPTTNPPTPENPVNGAPVADGTGTSSDAVDFFPYRASFQSDPTGGEFTTVDAPMPVNDAAPTVSVSADKAAYKRGDTVTLTASPADDLGVHEVLFYDGAWLVGRAERPPYRVRYKLPTDIGCAARTLTAVVADSAGQTKSVTTSIAIDASDCVTTPSPTPTPTATPTPTPTPLSVSFGIVPTKIPASGIKIEINPVATAGVRKIDVFLGTRQVCSLTAAPYVCTIKPKGTEVGAQSLRVVLTDKAGATVTASRNVVVQKFTPKGMSLSASISRNKADISGKLKLPSQVSLAEGCKSGTVSLVVTRGSKVIDDSQVRLSKTCSFSARVALSKSGVTKVTARFRGNTVLAPIKSSRRFS